jgi:hypothetical protein
MIWIVYDAFVRSLKSTGVVLTCTHLRAHAQSRKGRRSFMAPIKPSATFSPAIFHLMRVDIAGKRQRTGAFVCQCCFPVLACIRQIAATNFRLIAGGRRRSGLTAFPSASIDAGIGRSIAAKSLSPLRQGRLTAGSLYTDKSQPSIPRLTN